MGPGTTTRSPLAPHLVEAAHQALRLLHDAALDPPLHHPLDVLLLVLLRDRDVGPSGLQLALCDLGLTQEGLTMKQALEGVRALSRKQA